MYSISSKNLIKINYNCNKLQLIYLSNKILLKVQEKIKFSQENLMFPNDFHQFKAYLKSFKNFPKISFRLRQQKDDIFILFIYFLYFFYNKNEKIKRFQIL